MKTERHHGYQFEDLRFCCSLPVQKNGLRSKERQHAGDGYNPVMDLQRSYEYVTARVNEAVSTICVFCLDSFIKKLVAAGMGHLDQRK